MYTLNKNKGFELPYEVVDGKIIFKNSSLFKLGALPCIGSGSKSDVYKLRIDSKFYAFKLFNGLYKPEIDNFSRKQKLDIYSYVTPQLLAYYKDKFIGYVMEYCSGGDLEKRKLDLIVDEFIKDYKRLEKDTDELSLKGFTVYDTFISNVMYDKGFKMIDTDDYPYHEVSDKSIHDLNRRRLNQTMTNIFINSTELGLLFFSNVELTKLKSFCESGKMDFIDFFYEIYNKALKTGEEIHNISDIGKVLTKKR